MHSELRFFSLDIFRMASCNGWTPRFSQFIECAPLIWDKLEEIRYLI